MAMLLLMGSFVDQRPCDLTFLPICATLILNFVEAGPDMDDNTPTQETNKWLELAKQGKDVWNAWAEKELEKSLDKRETVDFSGLKIKEIDFSYFIFPGKADFNATQFSGDALFRKVQFYGMVYFSDAQFFEEAYFRRVQCHQEANFSLVKFSGNANFSAIQFSKDSDFKDTVFSKDADFNATQFSGKANFKKAKFLQEVNFSDVLFSKETDFSIAEFSEEANFAASTFTRKTLFSQVKIEKALSFTAVNFEGAVYFTEIDFLKPPDLNTASFKIPPSFLGSQFYYPASNKWDKFRGKCELVDGHARYLRLKKIAADVQDHQSELQLFAYEMKAKRFHILKLSNPRDWLTLIISYIYEITSNFGQSIARPAFFLVALFFASCLMFSTIPENDVSFWDSGIRSFALANLLPTSGLQSEVRTNVIEAICEAHMDDSPIKVRELYQMSSDKFPLIKACGYIIPEIHLKATLVNLCSVILFFLLGLGIRNQFRIK